MTSWRSGSFVFGTSSTPASGTSVRDVIASYRRAQYLVVGSTVASISDESNSFEDEEAAIQSRFEDEEQIEPEESLRTDGESTPVVDQDEALVGQFHWDDLDNVPVATPTQDDAPSPFRTTWREELSRSADEGTPLLRPTTSFASTPTQRRSGPSAVASRFQVPNEGRTYGTDNDAQMPHTRPLVRRTSTSSKAGHSKHNFGGQSTFGQTLFNSTAILLGIGVLSEPLAFSYAGWVLGTILIVGYGFVSCYTAKLLARIILSDHRLRSYADIGRKAFGPKSTVVISIMFCLELFAVSVILVTLYADSLHAIIPDYSSNTYKIWGLLLLIPTIFLPLSLLSYTSMLGIMSTVLMIVVILYDGLTKSTAPGSLRDPAETSFMFDSWTNLGIAYGLFMAGFSGHAVIPSLARDMINPEEFDTMINWAFLVATTIYSCIGCVGYLMFGSDVSDEISMDLLRTPGYNPVLNEATLWMLVISPLSKFALTTQPLNAVLEVLLGIEPVPSSPEDVAMKMAAPVRWSMRAILGRIQRVTVALLSVGVSIAIPEFSALMAFLGSFSAFMICIIGPIAAKVAIERKCSVFDGAIMCVGVVMAVWGTGAAFLSA